jgi:hypothetical protein
MQMVTRKDCVEASPLPCQKDAFSQLPIIVVTTAYSTPKLGLCPRPGIQSVALNR